ncbi:hypothetical protein FRC01_002684 [Tulasnella sp. 417]|nr:hypothetical protein FRC01_002684 [Tulasnella sp. 417]
MPPKGRPGTAKSYAQIKKEREERKKQLDKNKDLPKETDTGDQTSGRQAEGGVESVVNGPGETEKNAAGAGKTNGPDVGETEEGRAELQTTDTHPETPLGDQSSKPRADGAEGETGADGAGKAGLSAVNAPDSGEANGPDTGEAKEGDQLQNTDTHQETPSGDQSSKTRVERADGETGVDNAGEAGLNAGNAADAGKGSGPGAPKGNDPGAGNGDRPDAGETKEKGGEPLHNTNAHNETRTGDRTSEPRVKGTGKTAVDGAGEAGSNTISAAAAASKGNGLDQRETKDEGGEELRNTDTHHETPAGDQASKPRAEGVDEKTGVDDAGAAESNASAQDVEGANDTRESEVKGDTLDAVDEVPASERSYVSAVEVPGLEEFLQVIEAMGSGPGEQQGVALELVDRLRETPLYPAYEALQASWKKVHARMSEMEARQAALPLSPPPSPQDVRHKSGRGTQQQPQKPLHSPPKKSAGQQTDPPPTTSNPAKPTPVVQAPSLDRKELKSLEAGITSLTEKIESMSQEMSKMAGKDDVKKSLGGWDSKLSQVGTQTVEQVKSSAGTTNTHVDKVGSTVAQLSIKLDTGVSSLQQSIKQLNDTLAKRPAPIVTQAPPPPPTSAPRLELKTDSNTGELKAQIKQLRDDLLATRTELLQADIAFKVALEGIFSAEAEAAVAGPDAASRRSTLEIAQGIRQSTLRLVTRCRLLFSLIASNSSPSGTNLALLEGEWAKCVEHLQAREFRERKAIKEKDEAIRGLQFFRFLVDQIRRGFYTQSEWKLALDDEDFATLMEQSYDGFASIKLLAQEMHRLQHSRARPRQASSSSRLMYDERRPIPQSGWSLLST